MSTVVECICGGEGDIEELADHVRREHAQVGLSYACGVCEFTANSESIFLAHCVSAEHSPKSDQMIVVRLGDLLRI